MSLIDTLNFSSDLATSLPNLINDTSVYKVFATDILLANLDSYINSGRNYYIYYNTSRNKFDWVFWDASLSFGAYPSSGVSNVEKLGLYYVVSDSLRPLFGKILATPELKAKYLNTFSSLFSNYFVQENLFMHIDSLASIIRPYVYADLRKMFTNSQFESNIQSDLVINNQRIPGLKSFITSRYKYINSQLTSFTESSTNPSNFYLSQNYPNPFNPSTTISFSVDIPGNVELTLFNILGETVKILFKGAVLPGKQYKINFNSSNLASGIYMYKLSTKNNFLVKKMLLLK